MCLNPLLQKKQLQLCLLSAVVHVQFTWQIFISLSPSLQIITAVRTSASLVKDVRKLDAAAELMRFEDGTPLKATLGLNLGYGATSTVGAASEVCLGLLCDCLYQGYPSGHPPLA